MFRIAIDAKPLVRELTELGKQVPARFARGINFAIYDARKAVEAQAPVYIDRPTPWTTGAIFSTKASAEKLAARVGYKNWTGRGTAPEYYMPQLTTGGGRNPKKIETKLKAMGAMAPGQWSVLGKRLPAEFYDAYGNLAGAKYQAMLRALQKGQGDATAVGGKKRRRKASLKSAQYWVAGKGTPSGIMTRWGRGASFGYFLKFVSSVTYRDQYPFRELMKQEFDAIIERALYRAIVLKK